MCTYPQGCALGVCIVDHLHGDNSWVEAIVEVKGGLVWRCRSAANQGTCYDQETEVYLRYPNIFRRRSAACWTLSSSLVGRDKSLARMRFQRLYRNAGMQVCSVNLPRAVKPTDSTWADLDIAALIRDVGRPAIGELLWYSP